MTKTDLFYKCQISGVDKNYKRISCHWTGFIEDIKDHFLKKHSQNVFNLNASTDFFKWTLPYEQDQENKSIIVYKNNSFLQEISYENITKTLYFSIFDLNLKNMLDNISYFQVLIHPKSENPKLFKGQIFKKYDNIRNLIKYEKNILEIDVDVFDIRKDREICWALSFNQQ